MKHTKKLLSLLLVLCLILSLSCTAFAADEAKPLTGKTVILHSNDVHGAIDLYAAMASLKADYEAQGAEQTMRRRAPRSSWPTPATTVRAPSTSASIRARTR